jgi:hypothetical protein
MQGWPCLSVRKIQLENHWTDLDNIWYGRYACGSTLKSYFLISATCNTNMADERTCEVVSTLTIGHTKMYAIALG